MLRTCTQPAPGAGVFMAVAASMHRQVPDLARSRPIQQRLVFSGHASIHRTGFSTRVFFHTKGLLFICRHYLDLYVNEEQNPRSVCVVQARQLSSHSEQA